MFITFRDSPTWRKAVALATDVYRISSDFPQSEMYGLTSQIRRASVSISSNIAEGLQRGTSAEHLHFLHIAYGSCAEVETQLLIAKNIGFVTTEQYNAFLPQITEVSKLLYSKIKTIKQEIKETN